MLTRAYRICHRIVSALISKSCGHALPGQKGLMQAAAAASVPAARMLSLHKLCLLPESSHCLFGPWCRESVVARAPLPLNPVLLTMQQRPTAYVSDYQAGPCDRQSSMVTLKRHILPPRPSPAQEQESLYPGTPWSGESAQHTAANAVNSML